jgi:hypothetical protein
MTQVIKDGDRNEALNYCKFKMAEWVRMVQENPKDEDAKKQLDYWKALFVQLNKETQNGKSNTTVEE